MRRIPKVASYALLATACGIAITTPTHQGGPVSRMDLSSTLGSLGALGIAAIASWFVCWLIIRYEDLHSHFSYDAVGSGPQKFHAVPTPRIGGIAIATGLLAGGSLLFAILPQVSLRDQANLIIASVPAFLGGLTEDVTKRVGVTERLLMTMLSAAIGVILIGALLSRLDVPLLDTLLEWRPLAILVTIVAVGGVANATNIVDGYNGLAAGLALIVLSGIALVALQVSDFLVFSCALTIIGSIAGFLVWNWPGGRIFLGDGGAYLLGFLMAELSVLLVVRNSSVSAWFPLLLLVHPIVETLFSIYRRKWLRGHAPGRPDALHLHQLIYSRIVRFNVAGRCSKGLLRRNSSVAPYVWGPSAIVCVLSVLNYSSAIVLLACALAYGCLYVAIYRLISAWRTPSWLKQT